MVMVMVFVMVVVMVLVMVTVLVVEGGASGAMRVFVPGKQGSVWLRVWQNSAFV